MSLQGGLSSLVASPLLAFHQKVHRSVDGQIEQNIDAFGDPLNSLAVQENVLY